MKVSSLHFQPLPPINVRPSKGHHLLQSLFLLLLHILSLLLLPLHYKGWHPSALLWLLLHLAGTIALTQVLLKTASEKSGDLLFSACFLEEGCNVVRHPDYECDDVINYLWHIYCDVLLHELLYDPKRTCSCTQKPVAVA